MRQSPAGREVNIPNEEPAKGELPAIKSPFGFLWRSDDSCHLFFRRWFWRLAPLTLT